MRKKLLIAGLFAFVALAGTAFLATNNLTGSADCCGWFDIWTNVCGMVK